MTVPPPRTADQAAARTLPRWPVPLPLHLALSNMILASSATALLLSRQGSIDWKPPCRAAAAELEPLLRACPLELLAPALLQAALERLGRVQDGIERYAAAPVVRPPPPGPAIWQAGSTRLYDGAPHLAGSTAPQVLLVPSLINRGHVLALGPAHGLVGYLAARGLRPLLLDWDEPGTEERGFDLARYVEHRLLPALRAVREAAAGKRRPGRTATAPVTVLGYCMGGLLALAAVLRERRAGIEATPVASLALVATPWDFSVDPLFAAIGQVVTVRRDSLRRWIRANGVLPPEFLQALFVLRDPSLSLRKFGSFAAMPAGGGEEAAFLDLEGWANDGVPLAGPAAEDCLLDWIGANSPARGAWQVCGQNMLPEELQLPVFAAIAARDRLVPAASAAALAARLPDVDRLDVAGGHVGMVAGRHAQTGLWQPLADWLLARCTAA